MYLVGYNAHTDTPVPSIFGDPSTTIAGVIFHIDTTHAHPITTLELTARQYDTAVAGMQRVSDARGDLRPLYIAGAATDATANPDTQPTALYQNHAYAVELRMPSNWRPENQPYDEISNGFDSPAGRSGGYLKIDGITASSLDAAVNANAHHLLKPYGDNPVIVDVQVAAGNGKLILPDPANQSIKDAAVILPYPSLLPGTQTRSPFPYLVLYSDGSNIMRVAESLRFVDPALMPQPASPPGGASSPGGGTG